MAVSLYTNTRPREIKNEDRREAKRVLVFTPQGQKCFKSRHKCRMFDSISDKGKVLKTWRVSWICSEEWRWLQRTLQRWLVVISMSLFAWLVIKSPHPLTSNPGRMCLYMDDQIQMCYYSQNEMSCFHWTREYYACLVLLHYFRAIVNNFVSVCSGMSQCYYRGGEPIEWSPIPNIYSKFVPLFRVVLSVRAQT